MYRLIKPLAIIVLITVSVALYRTWVERNKLPIFIPLGFFENATPVKTPEERALDRKTWNDPITSIVRDDETFGSLARNAGAEEHAVDVFVTGATFGGLSAAISAAENGVSVALVSDAGWTSELLTNAGRYLTDNVATDVPFSNVERRLQKWNSPNISTIDGINKRAMLPTDVVEYFDKLIRSKSSLQVFESHFISAFGKDRHGNINRVLVQATDGSNASVIRFSYMIDGTQDGAAMALAGARTKTGWDTFEETGETNAISAESTAFIEGGYTMSGRTTLGIGRRLDGVRMNLAVMDRGYHGMFAHPTSVNDCWVAAPTSAAPFILEGVVYKAQKIGCEITTVIQPTFDDTVEVFYINHGAQSVSATIKIGSGAVFNLVTEGGQNDEFIRIGAFPASQAVPLSITVRSSSPTDRFEGFIVRKTNVNASPITTQNNGDESTQFTSEQWKKTTYDAYVLSKTSTSPILQIDDGVYRTEPIGTNTFVARGIILSAGTHALYHPNGSEYTILIPQRPHRETIPLSRQKSTPEAVAWTFTARTTATVALLAPSSACRSSCKISLTEQNTKSPIVQGELRDQSNTIPSDTPVDIATIRDGTVYVIKIEGGYDPSNPPIITLIDESSELYATGTRQISVVPPPGGIYDVWVRSRRNEKSVATIGKKNYVVNDMEEWRSIGTKQLSSDGISLSGGGAMEIMAIPNVSIDAYAVTLKKRGVPVSMRDIPPGNYIFKSLGAENPGVINIETEGGSASPVEFIDDGRSYTSRKEYALDGRGSALSLSTQWAQRIFLYEGVHSPFFDLQDDQAVLIPIVRTAQLAQQRERADTANIARTSSGIFLFDPYPRGIGPVTIGDLNTDDHREYVRNMMNDAYTILRTGKMSITKNLLSSCTDSTPTCDPRRVERAKFVYGTADALPPLPYYPDTRRLVGLDTLAYAQPYAGTSTCAGCATDPPTNAVLSFRSNVYPTTIVSPAEQRLSTLPTLLRSLRRDKKMSTKGTHFEYEEPLRDASFTLGMFISSNEPNILSGNSTLSATYIASRSIRSPRIQMAIGSVAGLSAAFAIQKERSDLRFIAQSADATARLQQYLVQHGITVMPLFEPKDDPLLLQAMQQRILDAKASLRSTWLNDRLTFVPTQNDNGDPSLIRLTYFGNEPEITIRDALKKLRDAPLNPTDLELLSFGLRVEMITPKMLRFSLDEIMRIPLDDDLLMKMRYLLQQEEYMPGTTT